MLTCEVPVELVEFYRGLWLLDGSVVAAYREILLEIAEVVGMVFRFFAPFAYLAV